MVHASRTIKVNDDPRQPPLTRGLAVRATLDAMRKLARDKALSATS